MLNWPKTQDVIAVVARPKCINSQMAVSKYLRNKGGDKAGNLPETVTNLTARQAINHFLNRESDRETAIALLEL